MSNQDQASFVLVSDGRGRVLLGKRRDGAGWTLPGGHLELGESPEVAARREIFQESSLTPDSLTYLTSQSQPNSTIHFFAYWYMLIS